MKTAIEIILILVLLTGAFFIIETRIKLHKQSILISKQSDTILRLINAFVDNTVGKCYSGRK